MGPGELSSVEKIKVEIEKAFSSTVYPGDSNIVSHQCLECNRLAKHLRGRRWQEIFPDEFERYFFMAPGLYLLTDEAFRFYLPSFLLASLEFGICDEVRAVTIFMLAPPDTPDSMPKWLNHFVGLNSAQRCAIRSFLAFLKKRRELQEEEGDVLLDRAFAHFSQGKSEADSK